MNRLEIKRDITIYDYFLYKNNNNNKEKDNYFDASQFHYFRNLLRITQKISVSHIRKTSNSNELITTGVLTLYDIP